jgi:hypothetical protein
MSPRRRSSFCTAAAELPTFSTAARISPGTTFQCFDQCFMSCVSMWWRIGFSGFDSVIGLAGHLLGVVRVPVMKTRRRQTILFRPENLRRQNSGSMPTRRNGAPIFAGPKYRRRNRVAVALSATERLPPGGLFVWVLERSKIRVNITLEAARIILERGHWHSPDRAGLTMSVVGGRPEVIGPSPSRRD